MCGCAEHSIVRPCLPVGGEPHNLSIKKWPMHLVVNCFSLQFLFFFFCTAGHIKKPQKANKLCWPAETLQPACAAGKLERNAERQKEREREEERKWRQQLQQLNALNQCTQTTIAIATAAAAAAAFCSKHSTQKALIKNNSNNNNSRNNSASKLWRPTKKKQNTNRKVVF